MSIPFDRTVRASPGRWTSRCLGILLATAVLTAESFWSPAPADGHHSEEGSTALTSELSTDAFTFGASCGVQSGEWKLVNDDGPPAILALSQRGLTPGENCYLLAIQALWSATDLVVQTSVRLQSGAAHSSAGIAVRIVDINNYYFVALDSRNGILALYKMLAGRAHLISQVPLKISSGEWHVLELTAKGMVFTASYDGTVLFQAADEDISEGGGIGLWSWADTGAQFRLFRFSPNP